VTNYEVVIRRGSADPIKIALDTHEGDRAEAQYEELRGVIQEAHRVNAPAVGLDGLGPSGAGLAVNPAEVTSVELLDAEEDPFPGQWGPTADYGEG